MALEEMRFRWNIPTELELRKIKDIKQYKTIQKKKKEKEVKNLVLDKIPQWMEEQDRLWNFSGK